MLQPLSPSHPIIIICLTVNWLYDNSRHNVCLRLYFRVSWGASGALPPRRWPFDYFVDVLRQRRTQPNWTSTNHQGAAGCLHSEFQAEGPRLEVILRCRNCKKPNIVTVLPQSATRVAQLIIFNVALHCRRYSSCYGPSRRGGLSGPHRPAKLSPCL